MKKLELTEKQRSWLQRMLAGSSCVLIKTDWHSVWGDNGQDVGSCWAECNLDPLVILKLLSKKILAKKNWDEERVEIYKLTTKGKRAALGMI